MPNGYMGKILNVDLSSGTIESEAIPDEVYEAVLGGAGLAARLLYDRIPAGADPLGPDNVLGFVPGLLTGTAAQFSGRWMVCGKSPLTGGYGESNCGGTFSPAIKQCGYDGIFVRGVADKPVYLKVVGGEAELVDADGVWGLDAVEAEQKLLEEVPGKRTRVALIGTSGENRSLISGVVNDGGRIAARCGLGAVMGSKRLKAIVLQGKERVGVADRDEMKRLNQAFLASYKKGLGLNKAFTPGAVTVVSKAMASGPVAMAQSGMLVKATFTRYGTVVSNCLASENGDSPCQNWKGAGSVDFPLRTHSKYIHPGLVVKHEVKKYSCYSCPMGCGGIVQVRDGKYPIEESHKPEYETSCALGTLLLNKDLDAIFLLNDKLNRAGMDTISAGVTVAFAMECLENRVVGLDDLDGLDLRWGNADAIIRFVEKMIAREGCGDFWADGVKAAQEKLGEAAEPFAMHTGGQELPMHDARFDPGFTISYPLEPTPGRHTAPCYQWIEMFRLDKLFPGMGKMPQVFTKKEKLRQSATKNQLMVAASHFVQLANGCGMCIFGLYMDGTLPVPQYINAATGWNHPPEHYLRCGERIQNLRQAFNAKHGKEPRKHFRMPRRAVGIPPLQKGPLKGVTVDERRLQDDWLDGMGWDRDTGLPTPAKLRELGLDEVAEEIHGGAG